MKKYPGECNVQFSDRGLSCLGDIENNVQEGRSFKAGKPFRRDIIQQVSSVSGCWRLSDCRAANSMQTIPAFPERPRVYQGELVLISRQTAGHTMRFESADVMILKRLCYVSSTVTPAASRKALSSVGMPSSVIT